MNPELLNMKTATRGEIADAIRNANAHAKVSGALADLAANAGRTAQDCEGECRRGRGGDCGSQPRHV